MGKRVWFREASLWEDSPGYFDSAGGFLTYSTHFSDEEIREALDDPSKNAALLNAQFSLLQNAFGVAQALDRVLVLPRLVGRFSRAPPRVLSEWGGATTDQVRAFRTAKSETKSLDRS